jgi:hypothetical protein
MVTDIRPVWRRWANPKGTRRGAASTAWLAIALLAFLAVEARGDCWVRPIDSAPSLVAWLLMSSWLLVGSRWM